MKIIQWFKWLFSKFFSDHEMRDWEDRFHNGYQISKYEYLKHVDKQSGDSR
jgi:hypothetical protein